VGISAGGVQKLKFKGEAIDPAVQKMSVVFYVLSGHVSRTTVDCHHSWHS